MENEKPPKPSSESSNDKVKLMCSYGGKIQPRLHDHQLSYFGGDTKILTVDRNINFSSLLAKLKTLCDFSSRFCLKYQLPGHDLDVLISVLDDDDVKHMMFEYDRIHRISTKPARLRLFIFFPTLGSVTNVLNPDFLFGFDKEYTINSASNADIPKNMDTVLPGNVGSDPRDGAEIQKQEQIQGIAAQGLAGLAGLPEACSRDSKVTSGSFAYPAPLFYRIPVPAGGYYRVPYYGGMQRVVANTIGNREHPVYNLLPMMPSAQEQKIPGGGHVSVNHWDSFVSYDGAGAGAGAGAGSIHPTGTVAAMSNHESKASQHDA